MIYLDWAATAPTAYQTNRTFWFNVNANYTIKGKMIVEEAKRTVSRALGTKSGKILFGGNATEIFHKLYYALCEKESWFVVSPFEHDAVYAKYDGIAETIEELNEMTWASYNTVYCHQLVNNVTGTIFDLTKYTEWAKADNHIFVTDLTAAIGKIKLPNFEELGIDIAFWSGHKLGTEKGIGCAWISDKVINLLGDDFKLWYGTPNVDGAVTMAEATWNAIKYNKHLCLYDDFVKALFSKLADNNIPAKLIDSGNESRTNAINAIVLPGINADALQQYLASKQIFIGIGASACAGSHDYRQIEAFGVSKEEAEHIIRISFGDTTSVKDIQELVEEIKSFKEKFV